jgi:hypothetical protein
VTIMHFRDSGSVLRAHVSEGEWDASSKIFSHGYGKHISHDSNGE